MKLSRITIYLSLFFALPGFAFGQARLKESKQLIKLLETKKDALMNQIDNTPYRGDQNTAIKEYFENINELHGALSEGGKLGKRFNEVFSELDLVVTCPKLWLNAETYQRLMKNCTKNRYFLCSEKVKDYEKLIESFKKQLNENNRKRFEATQECNLGEVP